MSSVGDGSAAPDSRDSISTIGVESTGFFLGQSSSSLLNSSSIHQILVEANGVILTSIFLLKGTSVYLHNVVMRLGTGSEVWIYLTLVRISRVIIELRFSFWQSIMHPTNTIFRCQRIESFWDYIRLLQINLNQNHTKRLNSFFSISETNQALMLSKLFN